MADGIHPLRERLARLYLDREYDEGDTYVSLIGAHPGVQATCYGEAEAQCAAVAAWLHEEAAEIRLMLATYEAKKHPSIVQAQNAVATALEARADAIYPKEARDGR